MSVVFVLIAFSILVAGGFLAAFVWAVRNGQFEDRYTPSVRMLLDEPRVPPAGAPGGKGPAARPPADHHRPPSAHHQSQGS
jgi:cbb3-type cytochrome oxidase maturation protein